MVTTFTRIKLRQKNKGYLFGIYTAYVNDEMSPIMWHGFRKPECLDMILGDGVDTIELECFYDENMLKKHMSYC